MLLGFFLVIFRGLHFEKGHEEAMYPGFSTVNIKVCYKYA